MGTFMLLHFSQGKRHLLMVLCLIFFGACKQGEFYEKDSLTGAGTTTTTTDTSGTGGGIDPGGTTTTTPTTPTTTDGGSGGGTTTTPTTPTTTDPTTPVVTNPPVVTDPVTTPVTDPVTTPVTPPVVVTDPVTPVTPPTEPVVLLNDRVEKFTQNTAKNGDVDILWVIDNSGSMADEQAALGKNFSSFINQFLAKDIDFKMGITTTDGTSAHNGKMVGDSNLLTTAAAKADKNTFVKNFTSLVNVGIKGSGVEQGLKTAASFTDRYASSFLRPDAYFIVVFLSDENDQSEKTVAEYIAKLQALKTNKGMVKAYSIVTVKDYGYSDESIGKRYADVSTATAGTTSDIKKDFSTTLLDMGGKIVNLVDSFALTESPYQDLVEVYVNNVKVVSGFTFNAAQRTVKFDSASLPAEGSSIEIRYKVKATVVGAI
jgi:hypothetical protein